MNLKSESRQFGEITVTVSEFDAWRGFQLLPRLGAVLGLLTPDASEQINMAAAIPALCKAVAEDEKLLLDLLACTTVTKDGAVFPLMDKTQINMAFSGQLWDMAQTLGIVMEVNFTDFLSKCMGALSSIKSDAPQEEKLSA